MTVLSEDSLALREYVAAITAEHLDTSAEPWGLAAMGGNGLVARLQAARRHFNDFCSSIEASDAPPAPERDRQEADLFEFVASAVSAIGCAHILAYALACGVAPDLPLEDALKLYPKDVYIRFCIWFPDHDVTTVMGRCVQAPAFNKLRELRNALDHRGTLGRHIARGGSSEGIASISLKAASQIPGDQARDWALSRSNLQPLLSWLESCLEDLLGALHAGPAPPAQNDEERRSRAELLLKVRLEQELERLSRVLGSISRPIPPTIRRILSEQSEKVRRALEE